MAMWRPCELLGPIARRMAARAPCSRYLRRVPLQMSNRMVFLQLHWHPSLRKEPLYRDVSPVTAVLPVQMVMRRCPQRIPLLVKMAAHRKLSPVRITSLVAYQVANVQYWCGCTGLQRLALVADRV
jgi:hypothetical protein